MASVPYYGDPNWTGQVPPTHLIYVPIPCDDTWHLQPPEFLPDDLDHRKDILRKLAALLGVKIDFL